MREIREIDGMPVLEVNDESIIGTWCGYVGLSIGRLIDEEFSFAPDGSFVWRTLFLNDDDQIWFPGASGTWLLQDGILQLTIETQDDPDSLLQSRVHFSIRMRENDGRRQLVLKSVLCDDEPDGIDGEQRISVCAFEASPGDAERDHREYETRRKKKITLDGPFSKLVSVLSKAVPIAVARLQIPDPVFCVRLFFHDTHAPSEGYCCQVRCLTEPARQRVLREEEAINVPDRLWHPTMGIAIDLQDGVFEADLTSNDEIIDLYAEIYSLLEDSTDNNVPKLRAALRRASLMLHMTKWPETITMTDDFVVFPADGSNYFAGEYEEDMKVSVPANRLELLRERGHLS